MLEQFIQWLLERFRDLGYPGIVVLMAIESSVLPLPSELVMPPAGYLAAKGEMSLWVAIACGVLGSILGALANYGLANWLGRPFIRPLRRYLWISDKSLARSERFFTRHGALRRLRPGAGCGVQMVRLEGGRPARVARQGPKPARRLRRSAGGRLGSGAPGARARARARSGNGAGRSCGKIRCST